MSIWFEWLTHALLGALVAEWFLGEKIGNVAIQWGVLLGIAPDLLELLPTIFLNTLHTLQWQQGPLHSILVATLVAWALSSVFAKFWKKQKIARATTFWWIFATWSSHALLDTLTVDGAAIIWPIQGGGFPVRISFNLIQTPGPVPALLMAFTLARLIRLTTKKQLPIRRRTLLRGCGLTAAWFLLCLIIKLIATAGFDSDLKRRNLSTHRRMETPIGYNLLLRRAVVEGRQDFRIGYRSLFESFSSPIRWTIYPRSGQTDSILETDDGLALTCKKLKDQTNGWSILRNHSRGAWMADLRHCEHRIWGEKKGMVDSRFPYAWNVLANDRGDKLQRLYQTRHNPVESTRRTMARTLGDKTTWDANPRLAGVTGSLPEFLFVED